MDGEGEEIGLSAMPAVEKIERDDMEGGHRVVGSEASLHLSENANLVHLDNTNNIHH